MCRRWHGFLVVTLVFLAGGVHAAIWSGQYSTPAAPIHTTDVPFPTAGPATVAVSLVAAVGADGRVSATKVMGSVGSSVNGTPQPGTLQGYIQNSTHAARRWKFNPAIDDSTLKAVASGTSITFVYHRVYGYVHVPAELPELNTASSPPGDYVPPTPRAMFRGDYPWNSIGVGAVVLVLEVDEDGSVADVKTIRSIPSLDEPSIRAVRRWTFYPALHKGNPVRSTAAVAMIYLPFLQFG